MKTLFVSALIILFSFPSNSQCLLNLGPDQVVCNYLQGLEVRNVSSQVTITNGTAPYTYRWSTEKSYTIGGNTYTFTASDFLDDSTLMNPNFISTNGDPVHFKLTVIDSQNRVCSDSLTVVSSNFVTHLGQKNLYITQGDSVLLDGPNIQTSIPIAKYEWVPARGVVHPDSIFSYAKPDSSVDYSITITDTAGCSANGGIFLFVTVYPVSVNELFDQKVKISTHPNPFQSVAHFTLEGIEEGTISVHFYDTKGQLVFIKRSNHNKFEIQKSDLGNSGVYFYQIRSKNSLVATGELILE
jgi:hypothetical protein